MDSPADRPRRARVRRSTVIEPEMKKCPDCAELVQPEARKCRYCGYRFDAPDPEPKSWLANVLPWVRPPPSQLTLPQLLHRWGVKLAPGEEVEIDAFAHVRGRHGYLVVTDRRVLFLVHEGGRRYASLFESPIDRLSEVELDGGRRPQLRLRGADQEIAVSGLSRELAGQVRGFVFARSRDGQDY